MPHISSSTEGYYVMADNGTGKAEDILAGPFSSVGIAQNEMDKITHAYGYPEFTGAAASMLSSHIRTMRTILTHLHDDAYHGYNSDDLNAMISDSVALLNKLPANLRQCVTF
jgi:hypothetical protein